jgi:hypothetical protein
MIRQRLTILALALAATVCSLSWAAETADQRRIYQSFVDGDFERAARLIESHLKEFPNDPVMLYNAACVYCHLQQPDRAASYLRRAVDAGLQDLAQIAREPDLEPIRDHPIFVSLLERLNTVAGSGATDALERWRAAFGDDQYLYDRDEQRHIVYATALDRTSHIEMRRMIERQADQLESSLFEPSPESYLLIAVPTPSDGRRLFRTDQAGGIYEHDKRRLISRDTGSSLRHELVHALHYAHMDQLGQRHPLWVQEGLASLYESYAITEQGGIEFLPNERHNIVKGLALGGRLIRWRTLFTMSDDEFMAVAAQLYPQVRSIFEFLADHGKLGCWYQALIDNFDAEPNGARAFQVCFDLPLAEIELQWRKWVIDRPKVDIAIDVGDAALGIESELHSSNDGVLITRMLPGSAAGRSDLDVGDVIVAVDGRDTRSLTELQTIIATKKVGDLVTIRARREGGYFTVVVRLRPLEPIMW